MHLTTRMLSVPIFIGKFSRTPLAIPTSIQAAFYHLLKLKPFCMSKLLKNGSSHTGGGINKNATIPISYVLLKKEKKKRKQLAAARPIISYSSFIFGRLFHAASTVLDILIPAVYPGSFGLQSLSEIFQELHAFFCNAPIHIHLQQHNQDLVGFFTSRGCPLNRSWNLSTTWLHSMLQRKMQTCQRFHSLYSRQPQSPNFECFTGNLKTPDRNRSHVAQRSVSTL